MGIGVLLERASERESLGEREREPRRERVGEM